MRSPFERIPGIGPSMARDLEELGFKEIADLKGLQPEAMYARLIALRGVHQDRCVLYVFRLAVYYAAHEVHDPICLKWWNWKDNGPAFSMHQQD